MSTKTYKFKTFQEQITFDKTLPDDVAYDSLSDPINKVYETTVKIKICPTCGREV